MLGIQVAQNDHLLTGGERKLEQIAAGKSPGTASGHPGRETSGVSVNGPLGSWSF